jgi:hypothetical protein
MTKMKRHKVGPSLLGVQSDKHQVQYQLQDQHDNEHERDNTRALSFQVTA